MRHESTRKQLNTSHEKLEGTRRSGEGGAAQAMWLRMQLEAAGGVVKCYTQVSEHENSSTGRTKKTVEVLTPSIIVFYTKTSFMMIVLRSKFSLRSARHHNNSPRQIHEYDTNIYALEREVRVVFLVFRKNTTKKIYIQNPYLVYHVPGI